MSVLIDTATPSPPPPPPPAEAHTTTATNGPTDQPSVTPPQTLQPNRVCSIWRSRLGSAVRTAVACAAVGCATIYTPEPIRRHLAFPAFAYVTTILITGEATLGDSLYGAARAALGIAIGAGSAAAVLLLIRPQRFSVHGCVIAVALSAFGVGALPRSAGLLTQRVALGQIVLVYTAAVDRRGREAAVLLPAQAAASTVVGAAAAVLALVVPYPRLACHEVKEKSKLYTEMASEKVRLLVDAFCANNTTSMVVSISQAKSLTTRCNKLFQNIKLEEENLQWERLPFTQTHTILSERLQAIGVTLKGMEFALASSPTFTNTCSQQLKDPLCSLRNKITQKLKQDEQYDNNGVILIDRTIQPIPIIPQRRQDLPSFFFFFCMKLLYDVPPVIPSPPAKEKKVTPTTEHDMNNSCSEQPPDQQKSPGQWLKIIWRNFDLSAQRLAVALKCSLSMGLAVLFGVLFGRESGCWSGLMVATAITPWREATFKLANIRVQGTALGSIYGVMGSIISQNLMVIRFLILIPWIIFTSFLRHSRMYGPAGAIAAIIAAFIIMGRKNIGSPSAFAINRLTETFIGLSCTICAELLLQPARAATLARTQLSKILHTLDKCMESMDLQAYEAQLKENQKKLRQQVKELTQYIAEADGEPNFWFQPFPTDCYKKLHCSLAKVVEMIHFLVQGMELLARVSNGLRTAWDENQETIHGDLEHFKKLVGSSLRYFEEVSQQRPLSRLDDGDLEKRTMPSDPEVLGRAERQRDYGALSVDEEESERVAASFLQHAREMMGRLDDEDEGGELKGLIVLYLASIAFCMEVLMGETKEIEKGILEIVQLENRDNHILSLSEISSRIRGLSTWSLCTHS